MVKIAEKPSLFLNELLFYLVFTTSHVFSKTSIPDSLHIGSFPFIFLLLWFLVYSSFSPIESEKAQKFCWPQEFAFLVEFKKNEFESRPLGKIKQSEKMIIRAD